MPFARRVFIMSGIVAVLCLSLFSAAPAQAAGGLCCVYKLKSSDGSPVGDPQYKVKFGAPRTDCPSHPPADQTYVGTVVNNSKVCADTKLRTFTEATYPSEFDAFWAEVTKAGGEMIAGAVFGGAKAITDGASAAVGAVNKLGSQLNHGRFMVNWFQLEKLNKLGTDVPEIIGKVIKAAMGVIGSIAFALFIYAGVLWMVSAGNSDRIEKARGIMVWTSLGILVIFSSYALVNMIFDAFK